ncbi:MAG TPA: AtpZ/AtpI family protein [Alphaproteobacteria bacterium]|nr:AtpZ/AtpI family protein [Alphaproteobacteria bacterium]
MTANPDNDLDALEARIKAAEHQADEANSITSAPKTSGSADAMRLAMDLVISVAIGVGLGVLLDNYLGTKPWFMLIFMIFGVAAGFRNFYLFAGKLLHPNKEIK